MALKEQMSSIQYFREFIGEEIKKSRKTGVVIGVSGGIDSSVCLFLAAGIVEPASVYPLYLPHRNVTDDQERTILALCENLDLNLIKFDLSGLLEMFTRQTGCSEEILLGNFSARLRMAYLYHYAAIKDSLVINTGNRTEIMTGYCTKWGDQTGDICPLGNLYKTEVYELARELGVPAQIINAVPSAGFYEGQMDEEELGISYEELDRILISLDSGTTGKIEPEKLDIVKNLIDTSEHKRHMPVCPVRKK